MKMRNILCFLCLILFILSANQLSAQMFGRDDPNERVRTYDVLHISLDLSIDLEKKILDGKELTVIVPLNDNFTDFEIDAVGMEISGIWINPKKPGTVPYNGMKQPEQNLLPVKYDYDKKKLNVKLDKPYSKKDTIVYVINYKTTNPEKGMYFILPTEEFPSKLYQVWTQGEGEDNRYWFPCYDYPNEKQTTDIILKVDSKYQTLSNGLLKSKNDNSDGTTTWQWVLDKPQASYLVMLAVGNWDVIEDSWEGIPVYSLVPPGKKDMAVKSFDRTADMLKFFSDYSGFKYPWGTFSQVVVEDFIYGGMENTGAVVLTDASVYDDRTPPDYTAVNLVSHELSHQWWGDVLTCRNWSEIWLNESFATFFQCLYTQYAYGRDEYDYNIWQNGNSSLKADSSIARRPIYAKETITTNTYDKGSVVLNMLRNQLGDENFRKAMNIYITKNQFTSVTTKQLIDAVNEAFDEPRKERKPIDMKWFFDEWVYSAGQPEFKVNYTYNEDTKELTLNAEQVQRMDTSSFFKTPVPVKIVTASGTIQNELFYMDKNPASVTYLLDDRPMYVLFNRGNSVLCKLYFDKPKQDWLNQWHYADAAIDKITALYGLKDMVDDPNVLAAIDESLNKADFWGLRNEAANILGGSKTYTALEMLMKAYDSEKDSRVRRAIMSSIASVKINSAGNINTQWLYGWIKKYIEKESSYYAIAEGISAISKILKKDEIFDAVTPFLSFDSQGEIIRRTVMSSLDSCIDDRLVKIYMDYGNKGSSSRLRNAAIRGLGNYLTNPEVIDYLNKKVLTKTRSTQNVVLNFLEEAKDQSSKPVLEELMNTTSDERLKTRIKGILEKL
jgi:aminopeptidase N